MQIGVETSRAVNGKRIFVVHEDEITRAVLQFILQDENEAHDLPSLTEAITKGAEWPPDLLLLGLGAVQREPAILASIAQHLPSARVLLVADAGEDAAALPYVGQGAHGVVTKPLMVEPVRRKVDAALGMAKLPMFSLNLLGPA